MIKIQNIYYMLSYAFRVLKENEYKAVMTEDFDNVGEMCAAILIKGVKLQIKKGLGREYILKTESICSVKGKIDISESLKQQSFLKRQLVCNYDDFSLNSYMNRIIKTTLILLLKSDISKERKRDIRKLLLYFESVDTLNCHQIDWNIVYNKNNQTYRMLISICNLIINGLIQTSRSGKVKLMDFIDDQKMYRLYEKFILEYYKKEYPDLIVSSSQIKWDLDDDQNDFLPIMQSDIMIINPRNNKVIIIDTKYYSTITQSQYNKSTIRSANLYQIYTYVKNYDRDHKGNVSGMLLYAKTDEVDFSDIDYKMDGNRISIRTLDLNCDFTDIKARLNELIKTIY